MVAEEFDPIERLVVDGIHLGDVFINACRAGFRRLSREVIIEDITHNASLLVRLHGLAHARASELIRPVNPDAFARASVDGVHEEPVRDPVRCLENIILRLKDADPFQGRELEINGELHFSSGAEACIRLAKPDGGHHRESPSRASAESDASRHEAICNKVRKVGPEGGVVTNLRHAVPLVTRGEGSKKN